MPAGDEPGWGDCNLLLDLPTGAVNFSRISAGQSASLAHAYARFVSADPQLRANSVNCRAFQPPGPLQTDPELLSVDGLYTPLKVRSERGIELSGVNFLARLPAQGSRGEACLGVAAEHELAGPNVVENFLRVLAAHRGLELGGAVLHSAGLVFDEQAYIFVGRSNAGKTTLTRKAHQHGAMVLSDDINLLLPKAGGYQAYAIPFTGEYGRSLEHAAASPSYPVAGIILLQQARGLGVTRPGAASAIASLMVGCPFVNTDERETNTLLDNLERLVATVPVIQLQNRLENSMSEILSAVTNALSHA